MSFNASAAKLIFRGLHEMVSIHVFGNLAAVLQAIEGGASSAGFGARPGAMELTY